MSETIAIIGAGIAGLTAARILSHRGARVAVFEKSHGLGGRLASRKTEFGFIDHGAPYLQTNNDKFASLLNGFSQLGSASNWQPAGKNTELTWYVGTPHMKALLNPLAENVRVHLGAQVNGLAPGATGVDIAFAVRDETTQEQKIAVSNFDRAILTIPAPQAQKLTAQAGNEFQDLTNVEMAPCWAGIFAFADRVESLQEKCLVYSDQDVEWLGHNGSKPDRVAGSYVIHMTADFSANHLEKTREDMAAKLYEKLNAISGKTLPEPQYARAHRWRYARTSKSLGRPYISNKSATISAIGDWCLGDKAEHAFESALQLTEHLRSSS